jgi:endogenous inhibitor of DNA gyrase (YacG/DUF329 family)
MCGKVIPSASTTSDGKKQINAPFFPFCSERCRLLDLGAWLDGRYTLPAEPDKQTENGEEPSDDSE